MVIWQFKKKRGMTLDSYTNFASVYDTFMCDVPYEEWSVFIRDILEEYGISDGLVLDLGCGTGNMTELLAGCGYDMIGVDSSADMLDIAIEKREKSGHDILYLQQDMRRFELYGTVKAVVSICDSINYVTEDEEMEQVFHWVNNYLDPGGLFIFDFNTEYKYREVLGDCTIAENRYECSFIWDNYYYEEERMNEYELSLFIRDEELSDDSKEIYRRFQETHFQKGYTLDDMKMFLKAAGLEFIIAYDAFSREPPSDSSERICVIAREHGK